jgi:CRISPR-associated protein Cmr6
MPIAAVPCYLGADFREASPGLRFGLFLPIWTEKSDQEREVRERAGYRSLEAQEIREFLQAHGMDRTIEELCDRNTKPLPGLWKRNDSGSRDAWKKVAKLNRTDVERMEGLIARQSEMASGMPNCFSFFGKSIAPFATGLGLEHPLENGFAFLSPYGLPYLPGSGIKGVLRQAARELASGDWEDSQGWTFDAIDALFGKEEAVDAQRGALCFWDVIPSVRGNDLKIEVMTPHQGHYYQRGESPHESGQPNPILFLTLPAGAGFRFHVACDVAFLSRVRPELVASDQWKILLKVSFEHAFAWLGFGAKTAVGYGAMEVDAKAQIAGEEAASRRSAAREATLRREQETAGLSQDAVRLYEWSRDADWKKNRDQVLTDLEAYMQENPQPSSEARKLLVEIVDTLWSGILANPRATQGKKQKPKFNERPALLAERILASEAMALVSGDVNG